MCWKKSTDLDCLIVLPLLVLSLPVSNTANLCYSVQVSINILTVVHKRNKAKQNLTIRYLLYSNCCTIDFFTFFILLSVLFFFIKNVCPHMNLHFQALPIFLSFLSLEHL